MVYMHWRDPHLLGLMADRVLLLLDQFKPQELANIMWVANVTWHLVASRGKMANIMWHRAGLMWPHVAKANVVWVPTRCAPASAATLVVLARSCVGVPCVDLLPPSRPVLH